MKEGLALHKTKYTMQLQNILKKFSVYLTGFSYPRHTLSNMAIFKPSDVGDPIAVDTMLFRSMAQRILSCN